MKIKDLTFEKFIDETAVQEKIKIIASQINEDYKDKTPVFLPVLNGSFMFSSDLINFILVDGMRKPVLVFNHCRTACVAIEGSWQTLYRALSVVAKCNLNRNL